jgi:hypothetical protein
VAQKRCASGTDGSANTAVVGSRRGIGSISTRLAPRRPRPVVRVRPLTVRVPRPDRVGTVAGKTPADAVA